MPRPDSLPPTTHYQMSDFRFHRSTLRVHPDALALQVWADTWDDATTPRTDRPVRFNRGVRQYARLDYGRLADTGTFSPSFTWR